MLIFAAVEYTDCEIKIAVAMINLGYLVTFHKINYSDFSVFLWLLVRQITRC